MGDYISMIWENLVLYVFGEPIYAGLFILAFVIILGFKMNLSIDAIGNAVVPLVLLLAAGRFGLLNSVVAYVIVLLVGLVVTLMIKKSWR